MLRIGVLSDTHIVDLEVGIPFLERLLEKEFLGADLILHAGDVVHPDSLLAFESKLLYAVRGNMDPPVQGIPLKRVIEVGGFRIGLIHGWGPAENLEKRVLQEFVGQPIDCLVYGHSHNPVNRLMQGVLMFNPGSPTDRRGAPFHTVGILEIGDDIQGRILRIEP